MNPIFTGSSAEAEADSSNSDAKAIEAIFMIVSSSDMAP
jgi:hypothetical protein